MRDVRSPLSSVEDKGGFFMFSFLVNAEGGLTAAGYAACVAAGIMLFLLADVHKAADLLRGVHGARLCDLVH